MSDRSGRAEGMPWVSPYLTVKDVLAAVAFYEAAFGFRKRFVLETSDGKVPHGEVACEDSVVMLGAEWAAGGTCFSPATLGVKSPVTLYVYCEDVDALFERAVAAGATGDRPPADMFWGDRICGLTDPDGHAWCFATRTGAPVAAACEPAAAHA